MDENRDEQPLSSEELLRRAREGLGESEITPEEPDDFRIESYPPPTPEPLDESTEDESDYAEEPVFTPEPPTTPSYEEPAFETPEEASTWAPPPTDSGGADWTMPSPTAPAPSRRGSANRVLIMLAIVAVVGIGVYTLFDSTKTVNDIAVGDCMNIPEDDEFSTVDTIDCTEPHDLEVFANIDLSVVSAEFSSSAAYPGEDAVYEAAFNACWDEFEAYVGVPYEDSVLYIDAFTPTFEGWREQNDRIANCLVFEVEETAGGLEMAQSNVSLRNANR